LHVGRCVKVVIPGTQNKVAVTIQVSEVGVTIQ